MCLKDHCIGQSVIVDEVKQARCYRDLWAMVRTLAFVLSKGEVNSFFLGGVGYQ